MTPGQARPRPPRWTSISGPPVDVIKRMNRKALASHVAALVTYLLARPGRRAPIPAEADLKALHRTATRFLHRRPGGYRTIRVNIARGEEVVFRPPPPEDVPRLVRAFFADLPRVWADGDALDVAAHALWGLCWIHPFRDGNTRAAGAFAYACLCLKLGAVLPGRRTVLDLIRTDRKGVRAALKATNLSVEASGGAPDLSVLKAYLDGLLLRQVQSVRERPAGGASGPG